MSEEKLTLAQIAGVNMDDVEEFRFEVIPVGAYTFQVMTSSLDEIGKDELPAAVINVKVLDVHGLTGLVEGDDEANYVGKEHRETFFIRDVKDIGRIKAFMTDIGYAGTGDLGDVVADLEGHTFSARIKHRADKNDKSVKYANIVVDKKSGQKDA